MAVYWFSALREVQSLGFEPASDVFSFALPAISAGDIGLTAPGAVTRIEVASGTVPLALSFAGLADPVIGYGSDSLEGDAVYATYAARADGGLISSAVRLLAPHLGNPAPAPSDPAPNDPPSSPPPSSPPPSSTPPSDPPEEGRGSEITGTPGDDTIDARGGDRLSGGAGNDTLRAAGRGHSDTVLDGGPGNDTYIVNLVGWDTEPPPTLVDAEGIDTVVTALDWTLGPRFENLTIMGGVGEGGNGFGNELDNVLIAESTPYDSISAYGRGGNDTLIGRAGSDDLFGEEGDDWLEFSVDTAEWNVSTGGAGADRFVFRGVTNESGWGDSIADFATGIDALVFDSIGFGAIGGGGAFSAGDERFYAARGATEAHDASDRLIYDTSSGRLYYDWDGAGGVGAYLVATLDGAPALAGTDIAIL